jgi:hypothetical protein
VKRRARPSAARCVRAQFSERLQVPLSRGVVLPKDVKVAVIGAYLVELVIRSVPLIDDFFDHVVAVSHLESDGPLIGLPTGTALDLKSHAASIITGLSAWSKTWFA